MEISNAAFPEQEGTKEYATIPAENTFPWQELTFKMEQHFSGRALKYVQSALQFGNHNVVRDVKGGYTTTVVCPLVGASVGFQPSSVPYLCVLLKQITLVQTNKKNGNCHCDSGEKYQNCCHALDLSLRGGSKTLDRIEKYHVELVSIITIGESNPLDLPTNPTEQLMNVLRLYGMTASYNTCNILMREYNNDVKSAALAMQPGFTRAAPITISQPTVKRWKPETCGKTVVFAIDALRNFKNQGTVVLV